MKIACIVLGVLAVLLGIVLIVIVSIDKKKR